MSRRPKQETREELVRAGLRDLATIGLDIGTQQIRLPNLAADRSMSAGAAYYAFPDGQDEFQIELWIELVRRVEQARVSLPVSDVAEEKAVTLADAIRVMSARIPTSDDPMAWPISLAVAASTSDRSAPAREALQASIDQQHRCEVDEFERLLTKLEIEVRPPHTVGDLVVSVNALIDGFRLRSSLQGTVADRVLLRRSATGELQSWTLFGCALQALINGMTRARRDLTEESESSLVERAARVSLASSIIEHDLRDIEQQVKSSIERLVRVRNSAIAMSDTSGG
jgi:hypothetical protein